MRSDALSRRQFLAGSGTLAIPLLRAGIPGLATLSAAACTARDEDAAFEVLSRDEAREFEAVASRILPTTETPGAREAGVIWFIDKSFGSIMQDSLPFARAGLEELAAEIPQAFPGAMRLSDLDENEQDRWLGTHEKSAFFQLMRFMTLAGFFGMSSYGGNRDDVGWKLLGLHAAHHAWQPPFGHYDAEYAEGERHDS